MAEADEALIKAVSGRDVPVAADLLRSGANANAKDNRGITALLIATGSNQYRMANLLLDYKASVWATDKFGINVGLMTATGTEVLGEAEAQERERFIERLVALGFPWPPPTTEAVKQYKEQGQWPDEKSR